MRKLQGIVVSDKMDKTVVVAVTQLKRNQKYRTTYQKTVMFKAHDEADEYRVGDEVIIEATKPLSREKRWKVTHKLDGYRKPTTDNGGGVSEPVVKL